MLWRQCQAVEEQCLHCLPSDPNISELTWFFYEDPDRIRKITVLCSLHFTTDSFTNKTQFNTGFSKRLKKDVAVPTILDPTIMSQHTSVSNWSLLLCLLNRSFNKYWVFMSINEECMLSNTTPHSSGCMLPGPQSATPTQTVFWWGGVKNRTENSLLLLNYDVFRCKNNIISGPRRTLQNNLTPFCSACL